MNNIKLVILDRDGVINHDSDAYIKSPDEWHAIPGSLDAIARLNHAGCLVSIATNQSGIARGFFDHTILKSIHDKMRAQLNDKNGHIDALFYCFHHPDDHCNCRKPKPGLLIKSRELFDLPWQNILMIGDSLKDLEAAKNAGCEAILVETGKGQQTVKQVDTNHIKVFANLAEAVDHLFLQGMVGVQLDNNPQNI